MGYDPNSEVFFNKDVKVDFKTEVVDGQVKISWKNYLKF